MANCLKTQLKAVVQNDNLPYFDKGVIYYDSNFGDAEPGFNNFNRIAFKTGNIENIDTAIFEIDTYTPALTLRVKNGVTIPQNYTRKMYYKLSEATEIFGAGGSISQTLASYDKFRIRLMDLKRCTNITSCQLLSVAFLDTDTPNIEELSTLNKCSLISIAGKALDNWRGDIVTFIENLLSNGYNITTNPVFVIGMQGFVGQLCRLTVNGNNVFSEYNKNTHIVFVDGNHYKIYKNVAGVQPLDDYSEQTLVYEK